MKPAPFSYLAPADLDEALARLDEHGDESRILAGGQSLGPLLNLRLAQPGIVVDINGLSELDYVRVADSGELLIGAMTRQRSAETSSAVAEGWPLLTNAIRQIGHRAIRNRGTIGGSLAHADPAAELPAALVALGASVGVASKSGRRSIAAPDFFVGPFSTAMRPDEMLVEVRVPPPPTRGTQAWLEFSRRHGDFGLVGVAAVAELSEEGTFAGLRLAYSGAHWVPWSPPDDVTRMVGGRRPNAALYAEIGAAAASAATPPDDLHASGDHRRRLIAVLTARALEACAPPGAREGGRS